MALLALLGAQWATTDCDLQIYRFLDGSKVVEIETRDINIYATPRILEDGGY
jgi:hypothetical protein